MSDADATEMPASVATAWGLREPTRKGPKRGLSLERIVAAAIEVAVSDGLDAVSMNRVARALGTAPMSLYRYVSAKDELLELMIDAAYGPPPDAPPPLAGDWREGLASWAREFREALQNHPWVLRVPITRPPLLPNELAWFDRALGAMRDTGLAEAEKASVVLLVSGYVRNDANLNADIGAGFLAEGVSPDAAMSSYARLVGQLASPDRFPAVRAVVDAGVFDRADDPSVEFEFGLARVLDGIDALVRARA